MSTTLFRSKRGRSGKRVVYPIAPRGIVLRKRAVFKVYSACREPFPMPDPIARGLEAAKTPKDVENVLSKHEREMASAIGTGHDERYLDCDEMAETMSRILTAKGIRNRVIIGKSAEGSSHAWVRVGNEDYDPTHQGTIVQGRVHHLETIQQTKPTVHINPKPTTEIKVGDKIYLYARRGNLTVSKIDPVGNTRVVICEGVSANKADELKRMIAKIPGEDRGSLQFILLSGGMQGGMSGRGTTRGRYDSSANTIYLSARSGLTDDVFLHEYGHMKYRERLSPEARSAWDFYWQSYFDRLPNWRSKLDPNEGYAECYSVHHLGGRLDPELGKFFRR